MNLNEYVVAIPSYKRPKTLNNKSLRVLKEQKIMLFSSYSFL